MEQERRGYSLFWYSLVSALIGGLVALALVPYVNRVAVPSEPGPARVRVEPSPAPAASRDPAVAVAETLAPAVVAVASEEILRDFFTGRRISEQVGSGSGVIFDQRGYIVTNYHVVAGADRVVVVLSSGERLTARIVGQDPPTDLAVLKVEAPRALPAAVFADSDRVRVGETAIAIGNPLGMEFQRSVTVGVVSGIRSFPYGQGEMRRVAELIQTDAAINPGNSGGALADSSGRVIGINTFKFRETENIEGMGFAIPANTVKRVVGDLVRYGRVRRAALGVTFVSREAAALRFGMSVDRGLLIYEVAEGSPAERGGLRPGDVMIRLDGTPINEYVDAIRILEAKRPGERVNVRYLRDGREHAVDITLAEMQ